MDGMDIHSTARTPYNIYNTLSAYTALRALGANTGHFKSMAEAFDYGNNRESIFTVGNACIQLHLAKNPIGFQQKISLVLQDTEPKDIILRLKYEDIPCESTTDLQASVTGLLAGGTGNLYVIVNYSGLYSTNRMLTNLQESQKGDA